MAEDIIVDAGSLFKRESNGEKTPYPASDPNFSLREKKLVKQPKSYSSFTDIRRYTNNLNYSPRFNANKAMLPNFGGGTYTLMNKRIYKVNVPGFIYTQRYTNTYPNKFSVFIDGDNPFSEGPKYMPTPDGFPDSSREYFVRNGDSYVSAGRAGELLAFDRNKTYYEKFGKTYFLLYSSNNRVGPVSNNLFPICPGISTYILISGINTNAENAVFVPALDRSLFNSGNDLLTMISKKDEAVPPFNAFNAYNARYVFRRA